MNMVLSDLHHQVKLSLGKRLDNSGKTPFQPIEALINIEGQKQKCDHVTLNCVYPYYH